MTAFVPFEECLFRFDSLLRSKIPFHLIPSILQECKLQVQCAFFSHRNLIFKAVFKQSFSNKYSKKTKKEIFWANIQAVLWKMLLIHNIINTFQYNRSVLCCRVCSCLKCYLKLHVTVLPVVSFDFNLSILLYIGWCNVVSQNTC